VKSGIKLESNDISACSFELLNFWWNTCYCGISINIYISISIIVKFRKILNLLLDMVDPRSWPMVHPRSRCIVHCRSGCINHCRSGYMVHPRSGSIIHRRSGSMVYPSLSSIVQPRSWSMVVLMHISVSKDLLSVECICKINDSYFYPMIMVNHLYLFLINLCSIISFKE
jgi:hypothetical protein